MTTQEDLWRGSFGDAYHARQKPNVMADFLFWGRVLQCAPGIHSAIEFGAGTGSNLRALSHMLPDSKLWGVEVNDEAAARISYGQVLRCSILDSYDWPLCDLALTKGLLIHIAPEGLPRAYAALYYASRRYICVAEYYSPTPRIIPYHDHDDALWARGFAGEMMQQYPNLEVIDYGFAWRGDRLAPQDDVTWFLLEKR